MSNEVLETPKVQVTMDVNRYWTGQYSIAGGLVDGVEVDSIPEETDRIKQKCYKLLEDNTWYFDEEKYQSLLSDKEIATLIADKKAKIVELEKQIESTDYQIIKCYEYSLVGEELPYDIATLHEERQAIRDEINLLETEIEYCNLESS